MACKSPLLATISHNTLFYILSLTHIHGRTRTHIKTHLGTMPYRAVSNQNQSAASPPPVTPACVWKSQPRFSRKLDTGGGVGSSDVSLRLVFLLFPAIAATVVIFQTFNWLLELNRVKQRNVLLYRHYTSSFKHCSVFWLTVMVSIIK